MRGGAQISLPMLPLVPLDPEKDMVVCLSIWELHSYINAVITSRKPNDFIGPHTQGQEMTP